MEDKEKVAYFIGTIASIIIIVCLIPQLLSIIKKRSARDISVESYLLLLSGQILWGVYGGLKNDIQLIVSNVISCMITTGIIILACYFKGNDEDEQEQEEELIE
jgi:MtN3 and saliva related transmembrane protein